MCVSCASVVSLECSVHGRSVLACWTVVLPFSVEVVKDCVCFVRDSCVCLLWNNETS